MSDLAAFGQNTGRNDPPTTVTRSSLKYNEDEQSVYIPFSMMPNRMTNFDGYIPPFSTSNSASNTYFDFNGTQLPASRLQIDDNGITINSVSPEEYQGIKSFEYNARLNNPAGTYAVPDGYTFYAISSGTYLHQFDVVDDGAPVTVKYQDENGQELAPSELLNGYVGATYNSKELSLQGYSLIKVDGDATGKFTDSPQTVTYIYQKNAKLLGQVTVKYIDTDGKALFGDVIQTGNIGETYHTEKKELTGYTFKNIIGNASGQYTNSPQTVTYVYEKNANPNKPEEVIPDSSDKNNVNPDSRENETTKGSKTVKDKESVVTSKEKNLPETGDKEVVLVNAYKKFFREYFNFKGKTSRLDFWYVILSLLILSIIPTAILSYLIFGSLMSISDGGNVQEIMEITFLNIPIFIIGIIYLFLFVPVITMTVRRWRDVGLRASGIILIFCLLVLIVILGFIIHLKQNIIIDFLIVISSSMFLITLMPSQICCTNSKNRISQFFFCSKGER